MNNLCVKRIEITQNPVNAARFILINMLMGHGSSQGQRCQVHVTNHNPQQSNSNKKGFVKFALDLPTMELNSILIVTIFHFL